MHFSTIIPDGILQALSGTFIFSLWQGVVLAALAGLVVLLTKRSTSARRYNLMVGLLILFSLAVTGTFVYQYLHTTESELASMGGPLSTCALTNEQFNTKTAVIHGSVGDSILGYIHSHAEMIVMIWFLIVCARCVQLITGLYGLRRLRGESVSMGRTWEEKLQFLLVRMGIRQHVMIAGSVIARVPMVIGHFKPVILIPAALLTAMSPAEIEAVLVHELAHIRRRDYLVNMLQHFMEIIFFFNPAVLWVSSLIKAERENCCDDITLGQTNDKSAYIRALISCQEFQSQTPQMAVGLSGKGSLLARVSRMISSNNHSLSAIEKSLLACCLVAAGIMLAAFSGKQVKDKPKQADQYTQAVITTAKPGSILPFGADQDALKVFRSYQPAEVGEGTSCYIGDIGDRTGYKTYILKRKNVLYQLNYIRDTLVSLLVEGKNIPSSDWEVYDTKVKAIAAQFRRMPDDASGREKRKNERNIFDAAEKTLSEGADRTKRAIDEVGMALGRKLRGVNATHDSLKVLNEKTDQLSYPTSGYREEYNPAYGPGYTEYKSTQTYRSVTKTGNQQDVNGESEHDKWITVEELIAHMREENIIERSEDVSSFMINPWQMIMNGKKMPASIHRLLVDKYVKADKRSKWTIYYNFDISTTKSITRNGINAG